MFRNQYDTDVTVWSPEGRLLQVRKKNSAMLFFLENKATVSSLLRNCFIRTERRDYAGPMCT